jgi:hypothetical protein
MKLACGIALLFTLTGAAFAQSGASPSSWTSNVETSRFDGRRTVTLTVGSALESPISIRCSQRSVHVVYGLPSGLWYRFREMIVEYRLDGGPVRRQVWPVHTSIAFIENERARSFVRSIAQHRNLSMRVFLAEHELNISGLHRFSQILQSDCGIRISGAGPLRPGGRDRIPSQPGPPMQLGTPISR